MVRRPIDQEEAPLELVTTLVNRGTDEEVPLLPLPNLEAIVPKA
jgi:hypothetical protein